MNSTTTRLPLAYLVLLLSALLLLGCEDEPAPETAEEAQQAQRIEQACYHFEVDGSLEYAVTCRDYTVSTEPDAPTRITLMKPPVALILEFPADLEVGQYPITSPDDDPTNVEAVLLYNPLDGQESHFDSDLQGTLTLMRLDDDAITALFDFETQADSERSISVRGHLRDLQLRR